jgi:hypothetical protein
MKPEQLISTRQKPLFNVHVLILKKPRRCIFIHSFCFSYLQYIMQCISETKYKRSFSSQTSSRYLNCDTTMKNKPINIGKTQDDHPHRVLLTTLVDTHNIPRRNSLSVPFVHKVPPRVRNSPFQFLSLFLQVIFI